MTQKFSSVIFGVLIFVAIAATLFSTGLAQGGPAYEYCLLKCIDSSSGEDALIGDEDCST
ncbi:hypothetical protein OsJ_34596 [Oryza sativa Japonica Group]|uniref:Uncharacterized protein n=2 Tax=Oryza sativa subsp. japonica TaxID=39947 RepID=A0A8J8XM19_ORYSJ|nr:hypothetical protein LOC_Os11g42530 [Oryza sativa Japonica Group]EAZ19069.1 hypothetical protein OsJ_34596 [Oryza sativa Japonica Group]